MFKLISMALMGLTLASASVVAQEREWVLDAAEADVFLVFGVPTTNDVGVSFWCKIGGKTVSLFSPLMASQRVAQDKLTIDLSIDRESFPLKARRIASEGGSSVEAVLKPQSTILKKLMAADGFAVTVKSHRVNYPLEGADFQGLMKLCGLKQD